MQHIPILVKYISGDCKYFIDEVPKSIPKVFVLHKENYILSYQFDNNTSFSIHSSQRLNIDIASEWTKLSESALNSSRNFSRAANKKTKKIILSNVLSYIFTSNSFIMVDIQS